MDPMYLMEQAVELAREVYEGETDETGEPHIEHITRVAGILREKGANTDAVAVAWLHDLVEDTDVTLDDLREMGFTEPIVDAVDLLTHEEGQSLEEHLARVRGDDLARAVKHADLTDHASEERLSRLDAAEQEQARDRYQRGIALLEGAGV